MADEAQLAQVFQNLIANVIKFRREDVPPRVHVSAEQVGGEWVFSVTDNDISIDPERRGVITVWKGPSGQAGARVSDVTFYPTTAPGIHPSVRRVRYQEADQDADDDPSGCATRCPIPSWSTSLG